MPTTALAPGGIIGGMEHRAPVGVVGCFASYNFPVTNMSGKLAPALAMGNTIVVKPPLQDPLGVIRMCELFEEAGFPPGVVNVVSSSQIAAVRGHRRVAARRHDQLHRLDRGRLPHRRGRRPAA